MKQPNLDQQILESIIRASLLEQQAAPKPVGGLFTDTPEQAKLRTQVRQDMAKNKPKSNDPWRGSKLDKKRLSQYTTGEKMFGRNWQPEELEQVLRLNVEDASTTRAVAELLWDSLQFKSSKRGGGTPVKFIRTYDNGFQADRDPSSTTQAEIILKSYFDVHRRAIPWKKFTQLSNEFKKLSGNKSIGQILATVPFQSRIQLASTLLKYLGENTSFTRLLETMFPYDEFLHYGKTLTTSDRLKWASVQNGPYYKILNYLNQLYGYDFTEKGRKKLESDSFNRNRHAWIEAGAFAVSFFGGYGMAIAMGAELANAGLYWAEGDSYMAGMSLVFAALYGITGGIGGTAKALKQFPFLSKIASKLKPNQIKNLAIKLKNASKTGKTPKLTSAEKAFLNDINGSIKNPMFKTEMQKWAKTVVPKIAKPAAGKSTKTVQKLIDKLIKYKKYSPARKQAVQQSILTTIKSPAMRIIATMALWSGSPMLYDKLYMELNTPSQEDMNKMWAGVETEVGNELFKDLDKIRKQTPKISESAVLQDLKLTSLIIEVNSINESDNEYVDLIDTNNTPIPDDVQTDDLGILQIFDGNTTLWLFVGSVLAIGLANLLTKYIAKLGLKGVKLIATGLKGAVKKISWLKDKNALKDHGIIIDYQQYKTLTTRIKGSWVNHNKNILYNTPVGTSNIFQQSIEKQLNFLVNQGKTEAEAIQYLQTKSGIAEIFWEIMKSKNAEGQGLYIPGWSQRWRGSFKKDIYKLYNDLRYAELIKNPKITAAQRAANAEQKALTLTQLRSTNWSKEAPGLYKWWEQIIKKIQKQAGSTETNTTTSTGLVDQWGKPIKRTSTVEKISDAEVKSKTQEAIVMFMNRAENRGLAHGIYIKSLPFKPPRLKTWKDYVSFTTGDLYYTDVPMVRQYTTSNIHQVNNTTTVGQELEKVYNETSGQFSLEAMKKDVLEKIGYGEYYRPKL